ncbi:cyclin-dependent kinase inhibitor 1C-like [Osmerus eperlanus]|uniref:cyclin-dependent kinase inhibitor 1C-like n=1 Tax=Osmerus eperlanus TaxID=29151 RepID=UPI002E167D47
MFNIQLSSSVQERIVARRTFPLHARTSVCRSLFGPVDHEELNREMKSKLREISERDQRKWNFNFGADAPLAGPYEWEECPVDTTPEFYQESVQVGKNRIVAAPIKVKPCPDVVLQESPSQDVMSPCEDRLAIPESSTPSTTEVNQENCAVKLNAGKAIRKPVARGRGKRASSETNTTLITEFFVKRRSTETKMNDCTYPRSSSSIGVEQTPRKRIR